MAHTPLNPPPAPKFLLIGGRLLNRDEVKWAGIPDREETAGRVQVEFVSGGWGLLDPGVTLADLLAALNGAPF